MNLNERNDKQFFALVNRQRSVRSVNTPILKIDDKTFNNPVTVLGAWADYFEDLPTPSEQQSFDSTFLTLVNDDVDILTEIFTKDRQPTRLVIGTSRTVGSAKKFVRITSSFGGGEFTKTLCKVCTSQKLKFAFLLLEYCKIRECYAVANAFTIRNMYSLLLYM